MTFGNAGIELLLAVQGLLSSLWHWLWLFAALHMYRELKGNITAGASAQRVISCRQPM